MEDIYKYPHKVSNCKYYVVDICLEKSTNIEILKNSLVLYWRTEYIQSLCIEYNYRISYTSYKL